MGNGTILESLPLNEAINAPKSAATASLTRSGVTIRKDGRLHFINEAYIYLSPTTHGVDGKNLEEFKIPNARVIPIGNHLRIIDLSNDIDLIVPGKQEFTGSLWFDMRKIHSLDAH